MLSRNSLLPVFFSRGKGEVRGRSAMLRLPSLWVPSASSASSVSAGKAASMLRGDDRIIGVTFALSRIAALCTP